MSVRWTRTAKIRDSKFMEAIAWGKEMSGFVEKTFNTPKAHVFIATFGEMGTIQWSIDFPDLGAVEKVQTQVLTNPTYWQHVQKAVKDGLFIDGQTVDHIYREV